MRTLIQLGKLRLYMLALATCGLLPLCGCTGAPSPLYAPAIPDDAGQAALAKYDANSDGVIGDGELDKSPALKSALRRIDQNNDGKISAEEINQRIAAWRRTEVAMFPVVVTVTMGGRPLSGAEVRIVPEAFLGEELKAASGTTGDRGTTVLRISDDPDERGCHLGLYRVEVSKKGADGRETVPDRYNAQSELGIEVAPDDPSLEKVNLNLSAQ